MPDFDLIDPGTAGDPTSGDLIGVACAKMNTALTFLDVNKSSITHTHPDATDTTDGFLSAADKTKLDSYPLTSSQMVQSVAGKVGTVVLNHNTDLQNLTTGDAHTQYAKSDGTRLVVYAATTPPNNTQVGQLWDDSNTTPPMRKRYNGTSWEITGLSINGGTLTGPLVLSGDGTVALNPITYQQWQTKTWKNTVRVATTSALPTNTYSSGVLTASSNGALSNIDGIALSIGDRLLVKNEASGTKNGIYTVTSLGGVSSTWSLTRASDADTSAKILSGLTMRVSEGTTNNLSSWTLSTTGTITLDTTSLTFAQGGYVIGTGANQVAAGNRGLPVGGSTGQSLVKNSNTDYDVTWTAIAGGGGGGGIVLQNQGSTLATQRTTWDITGEGISAVDDSANSRTLITSRVTPARSTSIPSTPQTAQLWLNTTGGNTTLQDYTGSAWETVYANPVPLSVTDASVAAANKDGTGSTPSMRTLGSGSQQAAPGNLALFTSGGTMSGNLTLAGDATAALQPVTFQQWMARSWKNSVRAVTTAPLPTNSYSGGVMTSAANGAFPVIDGVTMTVGNRLLVNSEGNGANNGIYTITSLGGLSSNWSLTRASDMDTSSKTVTQSTMRASEGTVAANTIWVLTNTGTITLGTTALTFAQWAPVDGSTSTGSLRTLGSGSQQAAPGNQVLFLSGGTMTGGIVLSGDGSAALNPLSFQQYQARDFKDAVRTATTAALPANTYSGGVLTASANGVLGAIDGITPANGDRILVKNEVTTANNGIYTVTSVGSAGTPWTLTRATDADTSAKITPQMSVRVSTGTTNANLMWTVSNTSNITLGTTGITFRQTPSWSDISNIPTSFTPAVHGSTHATGGSDPIERHDSKPFTFVGTLPTAAGTTTGPLRHAPRVNGTIIDVAATIGTLPAGTGATVTLDLLKNGTSMYTTTTNRPQFTPTSSQLIVATLPDTITFGTNDYLSANLVIGGTTTSAGANAELSVRWKYTA